SRTRSFTITRRGAAWDTSVPCDSATADLSIAAKQTLQRRQLLGQVKIPGGPAERIAGSHRGLSWTFAMSDRFHWARLLTFVSGLVNQELLLRNEYLAAENRILRAQLPSRLRLSDAERSTLAEIANRLGRKALKEIARVAKPDTLLAWYRRLVAQKFDGSRHRAYPVRPRVSLEVEALVVRLARENRGWGYDRIVGALANLGHKVSDQTVGNILRRHNIVPAPERSRTTTWKEFIRSHMDVLAGADFFTVEVLTWRGLVTYYVLFF